MKVRTYGALMGALLTISTVEAAEAATCDCVAKPPQHKAATLRHAPAHIVKRNSDAGAEYAKSYYDYRSSSHVGEVFVRAAPAVRDDGWRVAPNDAHIRFYHDERVVYGPGVYPQPIQPAQLAYPQSYYPQPDYPPQAYYPTPASDIQLGVQDIGNGGVGFGGMPGGGGGGGGYGGQAFLYMGQGGGSDVPPNGGGVNLPGGYGPTYRGVWQGPVVPTRGGGAGVGK